MPNINTEQISDSRPLTFGEKAVGISFNPGGHPQVEAVKRKFADAIDEVNDQKKGLINITLSTESREEREEMYDLAIRGLQAAQMWAVKAATWQY